MKVIEPPAANSLSARDPQELPLAHTRDASAERKVQGAFAFALFCLTVIGIVAYLSVVRLRADAEWIDHTREVLGHLETLFSGVTETQNGWRGFVVTGDDSYLAPAPEERAGNELRRLRELTADNPLQRARLEQLAPLVDSQLAFGRQVIETRRTRGEMAARALSLTGEGERLHDRIRDALNEIKRTEEDLLLQRDARGRRSVTMTKAVILGGSAVAFGFVGLALMAIRRDFSGRRRAEAALRQSEESLSVTLHSIGDGVLATDRLGNITRMNEVAERLTGWKFEAARGHPVAQIFRIIHEPTRRPAMIPVEEVLRSGEVRALANHTVLVARDGTERAIADSAAPIRDRDGEIIGVVLVFRDVSEERAAELKLAEAQKELERFFTLSLDFLCISSADGFFKRASPAVTDILGWSIDEFLRQPFLDLVHPDDREATRREVERQVIAGEKVLQFENRYRHKNGTWRVLSWRSVPQPGGLMYATARDVTERRKTEEEIRRLNTDLHQHAAQIDAVNNELESFSYSISHDLRAPLRHVQGYVGMLRRESEAQLSEKGKRHLEVIAEAARSMGQLIDDLLSFSRMGRSEMSETSVDPSLLVNDTRRDLELSTRGRNIIWKINPLPAVRGDPAMLKQVFANLLGNAVKYTRPRTEASIEIGSAGDEDGRAILFVRDNGAGFDMKYAAKLFGVFNRLHRIDEFEGTGIGLANVHRIILRHGGRIWADAKIDAGATFYFTLQHALPSPT